MQTKPPMPRARHASSCASVSETTSEQRAHMISRLAATPPVLGGGWVVVGAGTAVVVVVDVVVDGAVVVVDDDTLLAQPTHTRTDAVGPVSLSVVIVMP